MYSFDKHSKLWQYFSSGQKSLIEEGLYLLKDVKMHPNVRVTDYSYLVFPFAKAYEGFLKQLFLDLRFISQKEYNSDHFRIGKALNPSLEKRLRYLSIFDKLVSYCKDKNIADELWLIWKRGRNLVFHYFPHNFRALSLPEAEEIINSILKVMEKTVVVCPINQQL